MEKIPEITECCICKERLTEPRILSCIHTFCLKCLEKAAFEQKLNSGDAMQCPICRKGFTVPTEGMAALQKNFFLESLTEISKMSAEPSNTVLCDKCKTFDAENALGIPLASRFCIQCHQNICKRCLKDHERFQELQSHQFGEIGKPLTDEFIKKVTLQRCEQHNNNELAMFCIDCQDAICIMCCVQKHKSHNYMDIAEVAEEFRQQISSNLDKMKVFTREASVQVQDVTAKQEEFQEKIEEIEKSIIERSNELKNLVDRYTKSLLDELAAIKQKESKQILCNRDECKTHKMVIDSFETYCTELMNKGSDADVCRSAKDLHLRAEELQKVHEEQVAKRFPLIKVGFEPSNLEETVEQDNIVGRIRDAVTIRSYGKLDVPSSSQVSGISKLDDKIYILEKDEAYIYVFRDQNPFEIQEEIELDQSAYPVDIERCKTSNCLYVLTMDGNSIRKLTTDDHSMTDWLEMPEYIELHLSVTSEDHLLVFVCHKRSCLELVKIYGSDAKLIRLVTIVSGISRPQNVIQKPNGEIIVSHMLETDEGGGWAISRLSSDGQTILNEYRPTDRSDTLSVYCHMVLDADNDRLFVADGGKDQVVLFDANSLNLVQILLTKDRNGISKPSNLFYDEKKKQLFIVHTDNRVDICKVV